MSQGEDNDKYVVYHGIKEGAAIFSLFRRDPDLEYDRPVRRVTMDPDDVSSETEFEDHFWVEIEENEIVDLQFDPEFTKKKKDKYQEVEDIHKEMQEIGRQELHDDDE